MPHRPPRKNKPAQPKKARGNVQLKADCRGLEFKENGASPTLWAHYQPDFQHRLIDLEWADQWAQIWNGLLARYHTMPDRPHSVHEAFVRGDRGYVAVMIAGTDGHTRTLDIRGLLYGCEVNAGYCSEQDIIEALHELGANFCTQLMVQATGKPDYTVVWEKPL